LSRRAVGGVCARLLASLFPAFVRLIYCVAIVYYISPPEPSGTWGPVLSAYMNLVVAPAIFLLAGTIPFLKAAAAGTAVSRGHPQWALSTGRVENV
jgi:hypothetical protein